MILPNRRSPTFRRSGGFGCSSPLPRRPLRRIVSDVASQGGARGSRRHQRDRHVRQHPAAGGGRAEAGAHPEEPRPAGADRSRRSTRRPSRWPPRRADLEKEAALAYARCSPKRISTPSRPSTIPRPARSCSTDGPIVTRELIKAAEIWQRGVARDLAAAGRRRKLAARSSGARPARYRRCPPEAGDRRLPPTGRHRTRPAR